MTTSMHRLQISLPEQQMRYLSERARRAGLSMAEVIRRLIEREAMHGEYRPSGEGVAVAERGESYMTAASRGPIASLTLDLPRELYGRLQAEAGRAGKSLPGMAQDWLVERLAAQPAPVLDERERVTQVLRAAGLLVELDPELKARADPTISLEKVQAALDRAGGKLLSEIILEQRGPKG
jgi:hypothetical protein